MKFNITYIIFLGIFLSIFSQISFAQTDSLSENLPNQLTTDTKPIILLNGDKKNRDVATQSTSDGEAMLFLDLKKNGSTSKKRNKKNKEPKGYYYGLETKRIFRKYEQGRKTIVETFYYLKDFRNPDPLVDIYYVFDIKSEKIKTLPRINAENHLVLHGPYERKENGKVVESGIYYAGTKHGRWENYHSSGVLTNKEIYYKGFPKNTKFVYYDKQKTKIKEIIPMESNYVHGHYIIFFESGAIKEEGNYQYGRRVKRWMSYYDGKAKNAKGQRHIETQYTEDPFDKTIKPYTLREWDEKGKYIKDNRN